MARVRGLIILPTAQRVGGDQQRRMDTGSLGGALLRPSSPGQWSGGGGFERDARLVGSHAWRLHLDRVWRETGAMSRWNVYFQVAEPAQPDDVTPSLWNDEPTIKGYYAEDDKYQAAVMEQYKLYVEMADRISNRRGLANTFFLTLHSTILTIFAVFWKDRTGGLSPWFLLPVLALGLGLCLAWFWQVRSYRQLNSGKFAVIGALERRLPASPWWNGEWKALRGEEQDKSTYWALSHLEIWVPLLFGVAYLSGFVVATVTSTT